MHRFLIAGLVVLKLSAPATAETVTIDWDDLIDQSAQTFEDPYKDLSYDQLDDLRIVVRLRALLSDGGVAAEARPEIEARLAKAEGALVAEGIDIDWLLDQRWIVTERRERAATAVNPDLDGKTIAVGGFAIAAPPEADGTRIVYLVPERGMCSHTSPPSPNQMIRARLSGEWSPKMMHEPVRLAGRLIAEDTRHVFQIVDGDVSMRASLVMDVEEVETIEGMQSATATNDWAAGIAERLRAAGQIPSKTGDSNQ